MWLFSIILLSIVFSIDCAKILAIYPIASYSHHIIYNRISLGLHSRGHELTILTTNPLREKAPKENYTEIDLSFLYKDVNNRIFSSGNSRNRLEIFYNHMYDGEKFVHKIFKNNEVQKLINGNYSFDLVMVEWSAHASFCAFSELFKSSLIGVRPMVLRLEGYDAIANPFTPSYMPLNFMHYENDFWGRLTNTLLTIIIRFSYNYLQLPRADNIVSKYFKNHSTYIGDIEKNVSIVLANTYPVLTGPRPLVPAMIEIGGIHLHNKSKSTLKKDMKAFLDNATEGVILFSFGTVVQSWDLPENVLSIFKKTFAELPYKILWRWGGNDMKNKTSNIKLYKWIEQQEVLAHPNVRLFITHGGLHSVEESLVNGVPMICIPFFADQHCNCRQVYRLGTARTFEILQLNKKMLVNSIKSVIQNNSYKRNAGRIGKILLDQPIPPLEKALWWIEYVLKHDGAHHLKSEAIGMSWFTYYSIDILLFVFICIVLFIIISILFSKFVIHILIGDKEDKIKEE